MWATFSLADAGEQLAGAMWRRTNEHPVPEGVEVVRVPVAFLWLRGDRAGPGRLMEEQVVASYGYWNDDSGRVFDIVMPGWGKDGDAIVFDRAAFLSFRADLEGMTKWLYSGETELLMLHYTYSPWSQRGAFAFDESVQLPLERMVREGRIPHLDALMHELITAARNADAASVWTISKQMAVDRAREGVWQLVRQKLLRDADKLYADLRPFVVCDLRMPG
jgi:hypothetical protein